VKLGEKVTRRVEDGEPGRDKRREVEKRYRLQAREGIKERVSKKEIRDTNHAGARESSRE